MNMMRKRLISLNLAILMLLSLVLPAGGGGAGRTGSRAHGGAVGGTDRGTGATGRGAG